MSSLTINKRRISDDDDDNINNNTNTTNDDNDSLIIDQSSNKTHELITSNNNSNSDNTNNTNPTTTTAVKTEPLHPSHNSSNSTTTTKNKTSSPPTSKKSKKDKDAGRNKFFKIVKWYEIPSDGFSIDDDHVASLFTSQQPSSSSLSSDNTTPKKTTTTTPSSASSSSSSSRRDMLRLTHNNATLPVALSIVDRETYPTLSRARKACRQGKIIIHRGSLQHDPVTGQATIFDNEKCRRGRASDRIYPGDVIAEQVRTGGVYYPGNKGGGSKMTTDGDDGGHDGNKNNDKPLFNVTVIYDDDHFAIVNKPPDMVTYAHGSDKQIHDSSTSLSAILPHVLLPPSSNGTISLLRKPHPVHRLDRPTTGLVVVAKTKPSMVELMTQFEERRVTKTYTAVINGVPLLPPSKRREEEEEEDSGERRGRRVTNKKENDMNDSCHVTETNDEDELNNNTVDDNNAAVVSPWYVIDDMLDDKTAVTKWRIKKCVDSTTALDNKVSLVEVMPRTGRYHQIRRHMAWSCQRPLIGDSKYDGGHDNAVAFRTDGLLLCANRIVLEHPYYNTVEGRKVWDALMMKRTDNINNNGDEDISCSDNNENDKSLTVIKGDVGSCGSKVRVWESKDKGKSETTTGKILVDVEIEVPSKFEDFMKREEELWTENNNKK